ncbi:MAG: Mov34/MPN/PAD-1 family protein [Myxococcales bacterium]|nr:Mov34/MPN/PAD-1 family protein [Myxococcales bacterium]
MSKHPTITPEALALLYAHARRDYPKECCGIVFGPKDSDLATRAQACRNIQDELHAEDPAQFPRDARTAYNFDAGDIFKLQKSLRGDEPAKIIYHSHANVGAYFSDTDQAAARMGDEPAYPVEYLVIDAQAHGVEGAVQFAWDAEAKSYVEVKRYG